MSRISRVLAVLWPLVFPGLAFAQSTSLNQPFVAPNGGTNSTIVSGGVANVIVTGPVNGCYVFNPVTAADQNIAVAETVYLNPITTATANGRGSNSAIAAGQYWACPPGMTTNLSGIAATTGHALNVVVW